MSDPMKDWLTNGRDDDLILLTDIMSECEDDKQSKEKMAILVKLLENAKKLIKASDQKKKNAEARCTELQNSQINLINDRETFVKFMHLVFPQNILEQNQKLIPQPDLGCMEVKQNAPSFDFDLISECWTQVLQSREDEQAAMFQDHLDEKKMLCQKIKELEQETLQTEQSMEQFPMENLMDNSNQMQNYWQTEMECFEEEPTLAQQFEFSLANKFDYPQNKFDFLPTKFDFPQLSDRLEESPVNDELELKNELSSRSRFEQSPTQTKEDQMLIEKCNQKEIEIKDLKDKIESMDKDANGLRSQMTIHQSLSQKCLKQIVDLETKMTQLEKQNSKLMAENEKMQAAANEKKTDITEQQQKALMMDFSSHYQLAEGPVDHPVQKRHYTEIQVLRRMTITSTCQSKDIGDLKMDLQVDLV